MVFWNVFIHLVLCPTLLLCGIRKGRSKEDGLDLTQAINTQRTSVDFDYDRDCRAIVDTPDDQLFGCLLTTIPEWEMRVCKVETGCEELIDSSVHFLDTIREANLNVVEYNGKSRLIDIRCPEEHNPIKETCIGFMQVWITSDLGKRVLFNENVFNHTEDDMISEIKSYQATPEAKRETVTDLQKIVTWMTPADDQCTMYKQICNLDGFFKKTGGFLIHSPIVKYNMMSEDYCHSEERDPTNERVLAVLKKFIKELSPAN